MCVKRKGHGLETTIAFHNVLLCFTLVISLHRQNIPVACVYTSLFQLTLVLCNMYSMRHGKVSIPFCSHTVSLGTVLFFTDCCFAVHYVLPATGCLRVNNSC